MSKDMTLNDDDPSEQEARAKVVLDVQLRKHRNMPVDMS